MLVVPGASAAADEAPIVWRGNSLCAPGIRNARQGLDTHQFFPNSSVIRYIKYRFHLSMFNYFSYAFYSDYFIGWITRSKSLGRVFQMKRLIAFLLAIYLCQYEPFRVL